VNAATPGTQGGLGALRVLVVDDEALARSRLVTLLADCRVPAPQVLAQASQAVQAMHYLQHQTFDVVLLDIHMPGTDGLQLAQVMRTLIQPPALVFVTAHTEHAVQAFELEAVDYLTKPVRLERLQQALNKAERYLQTRGMAQNPVPGQDVIVIQDRNRTERLPLSEVVYFKAELKYITVRTATRHYILDGSLNELEEKYPDRFMRIHRNALIAKSAARALQKHHDPEEGEGWALRLDGVSELLFVSRRQLAAVRDLLARQ
jgi:two-component system response regulator AlgR